MPKVSFLLDAFTYYFNLYAIVLRVFLLQVVRKSSHSLCQYQTLPCFLQISELFNMMKISQKFVRKTSMETVQLVV